MGAFGASVGTTGTSTLEPPGPEGHSVLGFLGNLIGGVKDVTLGLGKLIVAPAADAVRGAAEALSFGKVDLPGGYMTDDVIKGLAAMPKDYWDRYSPLLPGGRPASQFLEELYQKPVSFGLDALAVGSLAGKAAGAAGASRLAKVGGEAATAAEGVTDALLAQAKTSLRTAKAAGVRSGLEMLDTPPLYSKLLPEVRQVRMGSNAVATTTLRNPLLRVGQEVLETKLGKRSLMEPIETFKANITKRADAFEATGGDRAEYILREEGIAARAEAAGVKYIDRAPVYTRRATSTAGTLQRIQSGAWFRDRLKQTRAINDIVKPALDQMDEKARAASDHRSMKTNLLFDVTDSPMTSELTERIISQNGGMVSEGGYAKVISLTDTPVTDAMDMVKNADGTYTIRGWHSPKATAGVPAAGTELGFGGFHFGTREAADARFGDTAQWGGGEPVPVQTTGRFLGADEPLSEADNTILAAGNFEEAATSGLLDGFIDTEALDIPDYESIVPEHVQGITPAMQQLIDEVGPRGDLKAALQAKGYDGIIYTNEVEHPGSLSAMTFDTAKVSTATGPVPLLKELPPETMPQVQAIVPDLDTPEALRIVQEHLDTTLNDPNLAEMDWTPEKIAVEVDGAERTKDWLIREAEHIASGEADPQFIMDARLRVKDIIDHESQFKIMRESPAMMLERAYRPMQEVNGTELPWQQVDDAVRAAGETAPGYFPMVDADRVGRGDWTLRTPGSQAAVKAAKDPHLKYNEQILFREGRYMRDPLQARLTRAARHAKADGTLRYIESVMNSRVGRMLEPGQRLAPDEVVIPLEQLRGINKFSKFFYDARLKHMAKGLNDADATLEAMRELMDDIHKKIADGEMDEGSMHMYAVPKKVGDQLTATARAAGILNGPTAKVYLQGPMNAWRSLVLAGSPRWIVNNVLGNAVMSIMQGAPVARAFHLMEQQWKETLNERYGWDLKHGFLDEVRGKLDEAGVMDDVGTTYAGVEANTPTYIPGVEAVPGPGGKIVMKSRSLRGRAEGLTKAERKTQLSRGERALNRGQRIGDSVRAFNGNVETAFRMNSALTAAERIAGIGHMKRMMNRFRTSEERMNRVFRDGITEASARAIVKDMNFFLGDFGDLGPWERNLIRPYIFPFWGFYKHTAKLLLSYPFEYPERAVILGALATATQDMMDAYGPMPSWMDAAMPLGPPGTGDQPFLMTSGPNPFSGLFQSPLGGLSPLLKIPIEHFTGRNLFTGQEFSDKDTITPFGTEQQFKIIRDENGKPIGTEPVDKVTPSLWEAMLSQVPQYELLKDAIAGGKTFDTSGLVDAITHEGLIKDETGKAKYPLGTAAAVAKFAGFSQMPFDYSSYQTWLGEQQQAALTEALNREGYGAA